MRKLTLSKMLDKTQRIFNAYIRQRDSVNGYFICISCNKSLPIEQMNAGHYVPVKNGSNLRFNELNVNGQCIKCNCFDEFHLIGYRKNLINKIGLDAVEWLEEHRHDIKKWTYSELEDIIKKYKL